MHLPCTLVTAAFPNAAWMELGQMKPFPGSSPGRSAAPWASSWDRRAVPGAGHGQGCSARPSQALQQQAGGKNPSLPRLSHSRLPSAQLRATSLPTLSVPTLHEVSELFLTFQAQTPAQP